MPTSLPVLVALTSGQSHAADVDLFDPAAAFAGGRGSPQGEAPHIDSTGFVGSVIGGWAKDPVVRRFDDGTVSPEVSGQLPVTVHAGFALADRIRFDALIPTYPWVSAPLNGFSGAAVGDLRLQSTIRLVGGADGRLGLALVPRVGLPTGSSTAAVTSGISEGALLALGADGRRGGFVADLGATFSPREALEFDSRALGSATDAVIGLWWRPTRGLRVGAEADGQLGLVSLGPGTRNDTAAAHGFVQAVSRSGLGVAAGAGSGLVAGIGSPEYRVFGALTLAIRGPEPEPDEPELPFETSALGVCEDCPADEDGDGLLDWVDRCVTAYGPADLAGCPDRDYDGTADLDDRCPDVPGTAEGCPDRDGDGIPDDRDGCPDEPGPPEDGCPKEVWRTAAEVKIRERVTFGFDSALLPPGRSPPLDAVAAMLAHEPGIARIEVQGHTDSQGEESYNDRLSQRRAEAVVAYLVAQGVPPERLVARGYGERYPIATNKTTTGRFENRRVQFVILPSE